MISTNASIARVPTAILISGRGSNMLALAKAAQSPDYPAEIKLVISNNPEAEGLQKAADMGITVIPLDHTAFKSRLSFDRELHKHLKANQIQMICCAGYMRILSSWFVGQWPGRIINIHPSLLPKYKGLNTHQRALEAGDKEHGCTVHYVNEELDGGDIILQSKFNILPNDTKETLEKRVLEREHALYVKALEKILRNIECS